MWVTHSAGNKVIQRNERQLNFQHFQAQDLFEKGGSSSWQFTSDFKTLKHQTEI